VVTLSAAIDRCDSDRRVAVHHAQVLLLEGDPGLRCAFARRLGAEGVDAVIEVDTLAAARQALARSAFDCLVLDRLVSDGDAVSLVTELDEQSVRPPVLVTSARGDVAERVAALISGADDYMVKPIHLDELALRVRRLIEARPSSTGVIDLGRVRLSRALRNVTRDGERVHLTPTQFSLLEHLAANAGSLVTREELVSRCWDAHGGVRPDLHGGIWRLRRALGGAVHITSTPGRGYTLFVAR
jgi:DNA-binding response OmpR family regulator